MSHDHFAKRAQTFDSLPWFQDLTLNSWIAEHLSYYGESICDVGCGTGIMVPFYQKYFSVIHLVEPSEHMLAVLRSKSFANDVKIHASSSETMDIGERSVDIVISKNSLHHFFNPQQSLERMAASADRIIAIAEVLAPHEACLDFLRKVVLRKEIGRSESTIYTEEMLLSLIRPYSLVQRILLFDQYIDVDTWLEKSDLEETERQGIRELILKQAGQVREHMHIHLRHGRPVMLRRIGLIMGFKKHMDI